MNYPKKSTAVLHILVLAIICFMMFFPNMSSYPVIDTDETKFVSIAKEMLNYSDWINIKINGEDVFTLPPLFFWITNLFCVFLGKINLEAMRFPISFISFSGIIILYLGLKNILTKTYAFLITLIFATGLGTLIFSRLATNDMMTVIMMMTSILLAYGVILRKNRKTALYWLGIYAFAGLAVLAGGLCPLFVIFFSILIMHLFAGCLKEVFKPKHLIPGLLLFLFLTLPWPSIMIYKHKMLFVKESLRVYNFLKYAGIKEYGSVLGLFALAFSPWIFSFLWIFGSKAKDTVNSVISYFKENSQDKLKEKWQKLRKIDKFVSLNTIVFFTSLIFAVLYGAKYTFLTLFMVFPASCIAGRYWYEYIINKKHDKSIFFATIIPNLIMIVCSLLGLFGHNVLNKWIFQGFNNLIIPLIIIFCIIPVISIFAVILKGRIVPYVANIILMMSLSFVLTPSVFNFMSSNGGENDLIKFAQIAHDDNVTLAAYTSSKKYSILYYYDKPVIYHGNNDIEWLETFLKENPLAYVIVEIKDMWDIEDRHIKYMLLDSGKRYCLIQHMNFDPEETEEETEPEVIIY